MDVTHAQEFSLLLKSNPTLALQNRLNYLSSQAERYSQHLNYAKNLSFGFSLVSLAPTAIGLAVTPVLPLFGAGCLLAYLGTVLVDREVTKNLYPLPLIRQSLSEITHSFEGESSASPLDPIQDYLPPIGKIEVLLLTDFQATLSSYLSNHDPQNRLNIYRQVVTTVHSRSQDSDSLSHYLESLSKPPVPISTQTVSSQNQDSVYDQSVDSYYPEPEPIPEEPIEDLWTPVPEPTPVTKIEPIPEPPKKPMLPQWLNLMLGYPCVLLLGPQGSGKSTMVSWVAAKRKELGHTVEIVDVHYKYGDWQGYKVSGKGMNYMEANDTLLSFKEEVDSRYLQYGTIPDVKFEPYTLIVEEFTNFAQNCPASADFFKSSLSDIRKVNMHIIYVSHNDTLSTLGNSKGMAKAAIMGMLKLMLGSKQDENTGKVIPTYKGLLYKPGQKPVNVDIPKLS